ncbi:hypothetical protein GJ496_010781 [Pomphorhynchus laevis]|nr:hypothetical protein GJ496_010781 [Pomphorhynchus laevis]
MTSNIVCCTPNCNQSATLKCPLCLKDGVTSYFCSQDCFKASYNEHKRIHKSAANILVSSNAWKDFKFTGPLRPYKQSPIRKVPSNIQRPDYADHPLGYSTCEEIERSGIKILTDEEIDGVRIASKLGREVLDEALQASKAGVTTDEIDKIVHEACIDRECYPSPLNYYNFPKSCCTSVNEVVCHGIPDLRPLASGDILNVDVTVFHRGYHGDLNETVFIGDVDDSAKRLVKTSWECLQAAIEKVKPGTLYRDLGKVIQRHAEQNGCSVIKTYCGHGIHRLFHCQPTVPHYAKNKAVGVMKAGHVFTIEPMINEGSYTDGIWPDQWTAVTMDGKRSSQFEHTLLVTENGCDILTKRINYDGKPWFLTS